MRMWCKVKLIVFVVVSLCSFTMAQSSVGLGGGGSLYAPAVAPYNSNIMFISCDMTGLYRTTDGGAHWTMMDERTVQGSTSFSVAFDPVTQGHIIGFHPSLGLRESFDTGATWSAFSPAFPGGDVTAAAFSPDSPSRLLVGTSSQGIYQLQNGVWQQALPGTDILRIIFVNDPSVGQQAAYAVTPNDVQRMYPGGTWQSIASGLPAKTFTDIAGAADATHYAIYVTTSTDNADIGSVGGVYRYSSTNPSWSRQVNGLNGANGTINRDDCDTGSAPQYVYLGVASGVPDSAYVSAINTTCKDAIYKGSFSAGAMTWTGVYDGFPNDPTNTNLTPGWIEPQSPLGLGWGFGGSALGLAVAPNNFNIAMFVNNAAVYITTNGATSWTTGYTILASGTPNTSSARWQTNGVDITTTWNYYIHPDPAKASIHFIANTDIGLSRSTDSGGSWAPITASGNFYQLAFEYPAGSRIWAGVSAQHDIPQETQLNVAPKSGTVLVSSDDGATWSTVANASLPSGPVDSIIYNAGTLYASVWGTGVFKSTDGGVNWSEVGTAVHGKHVYQLRFDANGSLYVIVAGTGASTTFHGGGFYKLVNGEWQKLSAGLDSLLSTNYGAQPAPYDFAFDPVNTNIVYVCTGDVWGSNGGAGIYKYDLSSNTWTDLHLKTVLVNSGYHGDTAVAFAPFFNNGTMYVTTVTNGIWQSTDGGSTWSEFKAIPFLATQRMVFTSTQTYITTFGGGVWKTGGTQPPPGTVNMTAPANGSAVSGTITLSATASDPNGVAGVQFLADGNAVGAEVTASPYNLSFDTTTLANGTHTFAARERNTQNVTTTSSAISVTVNNPTPPPPSGLTLVTALALSPASPAVNQSTTATFTVQNSGAQAITVQSFVAGTRDPANANVDFPASAAVTLQPGQRYTYSAARSFATAGTYSTWPAYFDGTNWNQLAPPVNFTVQPPSPGQLTLTTAMALSPASPSVNQSTTATFTVQNTGGQAITVQNFLVGARDPANANVDFPATAAVTLQPGQQYAYSAARSFTTAGTYSAWPAYFDGTNWIQLATPANFTVQGAAPLFTDNFNRTTGMGTNWSILSGSYTTNGSMAVSGAPPAGGNWVKLNASLATNNYSVAADMIVPAGSLDSGLIARSSDPANVDRNLYAAQIATDGNIYLYRRNEWNWTLLASTAGGIVANTSYNLKLVVTGSSPVHLEVWLNGVQKIVFNDSSASQITGGVAGMENYDPNVKYDNFTVNSQ